MISVSKQETFYKLDPEEISVILRTEPQLGLNSNEAINRLNEFGTNEIKIEKKVSLIKLFIAQISNPIVIILLFAVVLSILTGQIFEGVLIISIVIFMAVIGVYLENNANNAVEKLKSLTVPLTNIIREGRKIQIEASQIVPGDILALSEGDKVPADARVILSNDVQVDEMVLTGESIPVEKKTTKILEDVVIGDQSNMIFAGTYITQGNLKAIVTSTGMNSELGKIAEKLSESEDKKTPLQIQLEKLSKFLFIGTISICSLIMILTVLRQKPLLEGFLQSLSLAIAFIPEGLTAVMTVVLGIGVREMVKKQAIIKRLLAAEGLGSVSILATDKTGTITSGKMTVSKIWVYQKEFNPNEFNADSMLEEKIVQIIKFCNNANGATEKAMIAFLEKLGLSFELEEREKEHRFSSDLKRMSVVKKSEDGFLSYTKGAPDILLPLCSRYINYDDNTTLELTEEKRSTILKQVEDYAEKGYRVLCLAYKDHSKSLDLDDRDLIENEMIFIGLIGLIDPLREEVTSTVSKLITAGIRPVMITGDHPEIAKTIAVEAGIYSNRKDARVITGQELNMYFNGQSKFTTEDLLNCSVFARVSPENKNQLIELYERNNILAAMAGDGINDVIAVNRAKIGIAVSNATDIVKEAADVVITGSYDALANAVEIGRLIMFRTRLYLHYLLSGNFCQVGIFFLALILDLPFPLTPIGLLIINLLTDAAPAMAMAFEKGDQNVMRQRPKPIEEGIINKEIYISIFIQGILSTVFLFIIFYLTLPYGERYAQTSTFTAYIFQKLFRAFSARSFRSNIFSYGLFSNKFLLYSVILGFIVWVIIVLGLPDIFEMTRIRNRDILIIILSSLSLPVFEELFKLFKSRLIYK